MNGRIWIGFSFSVALILSLSGQSIHAQMMRLKKTGPNTEPQRLIPTDARKVAATESQAYPAKATTSRRPPEFEMPVKVAVKPNAKRAHYQPRLQRSLPTITPVSNEPSENEPSQVVELKEEVGPTTERQFEPPTRETEFELPHVVPEKKQPPVEPSDEPPSEPSTQPTEEPELELPQEPVLPSEPNSQTSPRQPPEQEESPDDMVETLPAAPSSQNQSTEPEPKVQPAEPKPAESSKSDKSNYEEPVVIPIPRSLQEESVAPIHLPRLSEIDVRSATRLKPANDGSTSIQAPPNQAQLIVGMRPAVYYGASISPNLQTNRNTYPFCHKPLHFEDPNLERCGYHYGWLTTPVSMAHFFCTIPTLPYRNGAEPPWECVRSLPDCRYGHSFGYDAYLPPLSWRGVALQTAATLGLIYAVP